MLFSSYVLTFLHFVYSIIPSFQSIHDSIFRISPASYILFVTSKSVLTEHVQSSKNLSLTHMLSAEVKQTDDDALSPCFSFYLVVTRDWRCWATVQCSTGSSSSGARWTEFETQFWHLLVGQLQASHLTPLKLIFSF